MGLRNWRGSTCVSGVGLLGASCTIQSNYCTAYLLCVVEKQPISGACVACGLPPSGASQPRSVT